MTTVIILIVCCLLLVGNFSLAQQNKVDLYFFYSRDCPVCAQAEVFLLELSREYSGLKVKNFEIFYNQENRQLYLALGRAYNLDLGQISVPVIFIADRYFTTYNAVIATDIEQTVIKCLSRGCSSPIKGLSISVSPGLIRRGRKLRVSSGSDW